MWIDKNLLVSNSQTLADTAVSDYSIDLGAAKAIWRGRPVFMVINIETAAADLTSINFQVVTDTVAALSSPTVQVETGAIGYASLTAGKMIILPLASAIGTEEQYLGMQYTCSDAGTCTFSAFIALEAMENYSY